MQSGGVLQTLVSKAALDSNYNSSIQHPPYNHIAHGVIIALQVLYAPGIIVSSTLLIATVKFHQELHNTHNYIILSVAVTDLLVGLALIPFDTVDEMPSSRWLMRSNKVVCLLKDVLGALVVDVNLSLLTCMAVERFLQINYPICALKRLTKHSAILCLLGILAFHGLLVFSCFVQQIGSSYSCWASVISKEGTLPEWFVRYGSLSVCIRIVICLSLSIQVSVVSWRRRKKTLQDDVQRQHLKVTIVLLMLFVILYLPTVVYAVLHRLYELGYSKTAMYFNISRCIRFIIPLTNGIAIAFNRPLYRQAFRYFLMTHPKRWAEVQRSKLLKSYSKRITLNVTSQNSEAFDMRQTRSVVGFNRTSFDSRTGVPVVVEDTETV